MSKTQTLELNQPDLILDLQSRINELTAQNKKMRTMASPVGFFSCYFTSLPYFDTAKEAFNSLNDEYYDLFGCVRYRSFKSFKKQISFKDYKSACDGN